MSIEVHHKFVVFQSTSPLTREDRSTKTLATSGGSFNPLPSHEGRLRRNRRFYQRRSLSIHFPLPREDSMTAPSWMLTGYFQSTSLSRGKTAIIEDRYRRINFQSTSLSRGKTAERESQIAQIQAFNPLPSHEGRPSRRPEKWGWISFQSTSLSRGKTQKST